MKAWPAILVCGGLFVGGAALLRLGLRPSSPPEALADAGAIGTPLPLGAPDRERAREADRLHAGSLSALLGLYLLTSPGARFIDGQYR
jgi:hypothetical protein